MKLQILLLSLAAAVGYATEHERTQLLMPGAVVTEVSTQPMYYVYVRIIINNYNICVTNMLNYIKIYEVYRQSHNRNAK